MQDLLDSNLAVDCKKLEIMKTIKVKIQDHYNYSGITNNRRAVGNFIDEVRKMIFKWLNCTSQKKGFDWKKFNLFLKKYPLPKEKISINIFDLGGIGNYSGKKVSGTK